MPVGRLVQADIDGTEIPYRGINGSAMHVCGRHWHLGGEEMCLPACCRLVAATSLLVVLLLVLLVWGRLGPENCTGNTNLHAIVYFMIAACSAFDRNPTLERLLIVRLLVFAIYTALTIFATVLVVGNDCGDTWTLLGGGNSVCPVCFAQTFLPIAAVHCVCAPANV
jgi:hypothetical protein